MRHVLALLLLLAMPAASWASAIYVSPSGTDNATCGAGPSAVACKTIDYVFRNKCGGNSTHTVYMESTTYGDGGNAMYNGANTNLVTIFGGSQVRVEPTTPGSPYTLCIPTNTVAANFLTMGANDRLTFFGGKLTNPGSLNKGMAKCAVGSATLEFNNFELDHNGTANAAMLLLGNNDSANNFQVSLTNGTKAHNAYIVFNSFGSGGARLVSRDSFIYNVSSVGVSVAANNVAASFSGNTFTNCLFPINWAVASGSLDFQNNTIATQAGTARSGFRLASGAGAYFAANPTNFTFLGNNLYPFGNGATFDNILWDVSDSMLPLDISNGSWNPGFTEAQGGNGTFPASRVTLTRFDVPKNYAAGFFGDSIACGSSSSDNATKSEWARFSVMTGLPAMTHLVAAWPGATTMGARWRLDRVFQGSERPRIAFMFPGANNLGAGGVTYPSLLTNATLANAIYETAQVAAAWGATPVWLGIGAEPGFYEGGTSASAIATNHLVEAYFRTAGWPYGSWLDEMQRVSDWKTRYYANLAGDVHPNDEGHELIADLARQLFYRANPSSMSVRAGIHKTSASPSTAKRGGI